MKAISPALWKDHFQVRNIIKVQVTHIKFTACYMDDRVVKLLNLHMIVCQVVDTGRQCSLEQHPEPIDS